MEAPGRSPLSVDAETMRELGYRTVDMLVDRLSGDPGAVVQAGDPVQLRDVLSVPPPERPVPYDAILEGLERDVLPYVARISHPGYLAFIPGEGTWPGALGDLIASALNMDTCWWLGASGPAALELAVLEWIRGWVGYPDDAGGVLVSGGSAANLTALACARESLVGSMTPDAVVYMSDQAHVSLAKGARALGFRPDRVRIIASDRAGRMRSDALRTSIEADVAEGLRPLAVVANAGSTGVGAVDSFNQLSVVCRDHGLWLHIDGAYGGFACLTERGRAALSGMELADSITLDPHKWFYQPIELGTLLVRDGRLLRRAFEISHDYLDDVQVGATEVNFSDLGLQLTRTSRALKLWMSVQYFGLAAFRGAIDASLDLAEHAQRRIEQEPELELVTPASLGVVTFRRCPPGIDDQGAIDTINAQLAAATAEDGRVFLSTTVVRGRLALRLCVLNHSTTQEHVDLAIDLVARGSADAGAAPRPAPEREPAVAAGWLGQRPLDASALCSLPLFAELDEEQARQVLSRLRERRAAPGEMVIGQWQAGRDLYVILAGSVRVSDGDRELGTLGPGEFFGEMAALDWGASFGRSRVAGVVAVEPCRMAVLDWELVAWLGQVVPDVRAQLERAARQRIAAM